MQPQPSTGQQPPKASIWNLYEWLVDNGGFRNPQSSATNAGSQSSGERNGNAAGTKSVTAASAAGISVARSRAVQQAKVRPMVEHEAYMATAVELALARPSQPFAALLVDRSSGEVIADGLNSTKANPLFHGEVVCINNAARSFSRFDWANTILYTTAEPCCMCQAAIMWCRIPQVVYGTSVATLRSLGWDQFAMEATDVVAATPFANCDIVAGVFRERCDALFQIAAEIRRARSS